MGIFKLPFGLCDELTKMIRNYWWGEENGKRKTHWMAWENMMWSKDQGGIGFRDLRLFNQALLARQAWQLLQNPDTLCAQVLRAKYYPNGSLLDTVFAGNSSATWQAIVHGLDLLKKASFGVWAREQTSECGETPGFQERLNIIQFRNREDAGIDGWLIS
jgi:hypothetical protein